MSQETLSTTAPGRDREVATAGPVAAEPAREPFDRLARVSGRQVRLERWLAAVTRDGRLPPALEWLELGCGGAIAVDRPEVLWLASGLNRPGMIAHLTIPSLTTRMAVGIENALAHAVVDRLLGFDRALAESRFQLTPVEWGIWTFLILRALDGLDRRAAADRSSSPDQGGAPGVGVGAGTVRLDRAGPDPFDPSGLGSIVTIRWGVRIGTVSGSVRLWMPETLVREWTGPSGPAPSARSFIAARTATGESSGPVSTDARAELASIWRAEAGTVVMPHGLRRLRAGGILPLAASRLAGSPASPAGAVGLVLDLDGSEGRYVISARPVADSGGRLVQVADRPRREPRPREPVLVSLKEPSTMSQPTAPAGPSPPAADAPPLDVPVTLTVELGRVNLTLSRLADLKPGDVIELSRHSRAPVELTSGGRLVARGELILIDSELGVRVTSVFL